MVEVRIDGVFRVSPSLFKALNVGLFLQASSDNKLVILHSTSVLKDDCVFIREILSHALSVRGCCKLAQRVFRRSEHLGFGKAE